MRYWWLKAGPTGHHTDWVGRWRPADAEANGEHLTPESPEPWLRKQRWQEVEQLHEDCWRGTHPNSVEYPIYVLRVPDDVHPDSLELP